MRLEFEGKQQIYAHHLTVPISALVLDYNKSMPSTDGSYDDGNKIIHGDNLRALKALMPQYAQKVNVIFIDPPYNTGSEGWIYNDNVNSPLMRSWLELTRPVDGEDLARHDKWMSMIWPRLNLLRDLLSDDGVLFVTVDDNEQPRLRLLLDEIFGEDNFVANLIWKKKAGGGQDSQYFAVEHDYILVYRKSDKFELNERTAKIDPSDFPHEKNGRKCEFRNLEKWGAGQYREDAPSLYYPIKDPDENDFYPMATDGREGRWRSKPENFDPQHIHWRKIKSRKNISPIRVGRWQPCEVLYLDEQTDYKIIKERSILDIEKATTTAATKELNDIFGRKSIFPTPKPVELLKRLVSLGGKEDAIVLDSFAGSGTTAHAVLALNKNDDEQVPRGGGVAGNLFWWSVRSTRTR